MTSRVLLDNVFNIVRAKSFFEFSFRDAKFHHSDEAQRSLLLLGQLIVGRQVIVFVDFGYTILFNV